MKKNIVLIGGGGHCKSCIDVIELTENYNIKGIIDVESKVGTKVLGYPIIGTDEDVFNFIEIIDEFIITIGQLGKPDKRQILYDKMKKKGAKFSTIVSPLAYVSKNAFVEEGTIIMHGAIINADVKIGCNCIINSKALLEHEVTVGNHCHISTASVLNGGATIGDGTFYGSGAVSIQNIKIVSNSFIKANSIVK